MITAIKEETEVLPGGLITLHSNVLPIYSKVIVSAVIETEYKPKPRKLSTIVGSAKGLYSSPKEVDSRKS
ncbi:MAG TPA: hypothetical protein DD381_03685 [Lentisphaeria bacterium]|nr:MAG: hypothetical protein A2X47_09155 [Lentisphaerae bacterium GWF2_38_69]HBM15434.1 hypothetical protein [Lentisphaeria bacterium]